MGGPEKLLINFAWPKANRLIYHFLTANTNTVYSMYKVLCKSISILITFHGSAVGSIYQHSGLIPCAIISKTNLYDHLCNHLYLLPGETTDRSLEWYNKFDNLKGAKAKRRMKSK